MEGESSSGTVPVASREFTTTHWSVVLAAGQQEVPQAADALETLCRTYWYPLYAYVRGRGYSPEDAQDLTQALFAHLLSQDFLRNVTPGKGLFRSFLLACLKHFLADEWKKAHRAIRGGHQPHLALESQSAEDRYRLEPVDRMDAESLYERRWALTLLENVLKRLREQSVAAGKAKTFDALQGFLLGEEGVETYALTAAKLGLTEGAVKVAIHRLREHYRELFREEIAQTVADPKQIEDEMRHLFEVISR
jgi:DNA-directed RNA polymerase specialized sigma24 family protein